MKMVTKLLFRSVVRPFYKENAGFFLFWITIFFFIVSKVDGAELYEYQYSLVRAILGSGALMGIAAFIALAYMLKCRRFLRMKFQKLELECLHALNVMPAVQRTILLLLTTFLLLLPLLLYTVFFSYVTWKEKGTAAGLTVWFYCLLLLVLLTGQLRHLQTFPGHSRVKNRVLSFSAPALNKNYPLLMLRTVWATGPWVWIGSKLFTCVLLVLITRNNTVKDYDIGPAYIFYTLGMLSHSLVIYKLRMFEESSLSFYRIAPVSVLNRFIASALVMALLLAPEAVSVFMLTPVYLHVTDALIFLGSGFSLLLLMNGLSLLVTTGQKDFLKLQLLLLGIEYVFLLSGVLPFLPLLFFLFAILTFWYGYRKFEMAVQ